MKILVAVPCMDMVQTRFVFSLLRMQPVGEVEFSLTESSLIYNARNDLTRKAINEGFDRILWLDSDMIFEPDLMGKLSARLDTGIEFVSGLYFKRREPIGPVIYKTCGSYERAGQTIPFASPYTDYPDKLFEIAAAGFGGCMMTVDLVKRIWEKFGYPFSPILGFGEDLSFCCRVSRLGVKMYCDPSVKLGHVGYKTFDESDFLRSKQNDIGTNVSGS